MATLEQLLAAIAQSPRDRALKLAYIDCAQEHPDVVREQIARAIVGYPNLGLHGFHYRSRLSLWERSESSTPPTSAAFTRDRRALAQGVIPFAACVAWVASRRRCRVPDCLRGSDDFARSAARELGGEWLNPRHQGALIAAAVSLGCWACATGAGDAFLPVSSRWRGQPDIGRRAP